MNFSCKLSDRQASLLSFLAVALLPTAGVNYFMEKGRLCGLFFQARNKSVKTLLQSRLQSRQHALAVRCHN